MSDTNRFREVRYNVLSACTWRVVAELFRRHQSAFDLRVMSIHPGLSGRGILVVTRGPFFDEPADGPRPQLDLHLGGPGGSFVVPVPFGQPRGEKTVRGADPEPFVGPLLCTSDPREVIDHVEALCGLPVSKPLPTNRPTLVARTLAAFLGAHMLSRVTWRVSCGWYDTSAMGAEVSDWVQSFPEIWHEAQTAKARGDRKRAAHLAARVWMLHPIKHNEEPCCHGSEVGGPSMVFDLATGRATSLGSKKPPVDLMQRYQDGGGKILPVLRWVEDRMGVKV